MIEKRQKAALKGSFRKLADITRSAAGRIMIEKAAAFATGMVVEYAGLATRLPGSGPVLAGLAR